MPRTPPAFAHLAFLVTRDPLSRTPCVVVMGNARVETGADGLPLTGVYFEQDAEGTIGDAAVIQSLPVLTLASDDLPSLPGRNAKVELDDGVYTVTYVLERQGQVELHLSRPGGRPRP